MVRPSVPLKVFHTDKQIVWKCVFGHSDIYFETPDFVWMYRQKQNFHVRVRWHITGVEIKAASSDYQKETRWQLNSESMKKIHLSTIFCCKLINLKKWPFCYQVNVDHIDVYLPTLLTFHLSSTILSSFSLGDFVWCDISYSLQRLINKELYYLTEYQLSCI